MLIASNLREKSTYSPDNYRDENQGMQESKSVKSLCCLTIGAEDMTTVRIF